MMFVRLSGSNKPWLPHDVPFVRSPALGEHIADAKGALHEVVRVTHAWQGLVAVLIIDVTPTNLRSAIPPAGIIGQTKKIPKSA